MTMDEVKVSISSNVILGRVNVLGVKICEVSSSAVIFWERTVLKCLDCPGWPKAVERMLHEFWPIST